jgi:TRAP-type C4-dicarboxylate transport system permease small subunit
MQNSSFGGVSMDTVENMRRRQNRKIIAIFVALVCLLAIGVVMITYALPNAWDHFIESVDKNGDR